MNNKAFISQDLGCIYFWDEQAKMLTYVPINVDHTVSFDLEDRIYIDEPQYDEEVTFLGAECTLRDVYRHVEALLA